MLHEIEPAIISTPLDGERSSHNHPYVEAVAENNVRFAVAAIVERSPVIRELVAQGALKVVGAVYEVETGHVTFLENA